MSFEKFLEENLASPNFNRGRFVYNFKERQNISASRLDSDSGCVYSTLGETWTIKFSEKEGKRYIACIDVIHDLVLSVYDVNSSTLIVHRFGEWKKERDDQLAKQLGSIKGANLEARIIGMQHNEFYNSLIAAFGFIKRSRIPLVEIDLFGNERRHVAFDAKTGISFDVLVNNKPYKPGELLWQAAPEQLQRSMMTAPPTQGAQKRSEK